MSEVILNISEVADRYSILKVKQGHGIDVYAEMQNCQEMIELWGVDCTELERINSVMWDIEDLASKESDLRKLGVIFLALRSMTLARINEKNRIARERGEPEERKSYGEEPRT